MGSVKLYIEEYKILRKSSWLQPLSRQSINKKSRAAFAMRRPGVRSPLCSTNRIKYLRQGSDLVFFICHRFVTCRNGFHQVFKCLCSTNRIKYLRQGSDLVFFICHRFVTCRNGFHQVFKCSALRLIGSVRVAQSHSNIRPSEDFSQCKRIGPAVCHAGSGGVTQVMKPKVSDSCILLCLIKTELNVDKASFRLRTWKDIFACPR